MVITMDVAKFSVQNVLVESGSLADIIFLNVLRKIELYMTPITPVNIPFMGFGERKIIPLGTIDLPTSLGSNPNRKTLMVKYLVVNNPFAYNMILGKLGLNLFKAVVSTYH